MADMPLPPGAKLVDQEIKLPPGATLVSGGTAPSKTVGGFVSNVISSGANFAGDIAHAVTHPGDTLRAIGSIPVGLAEKAGIPVPAPGPGEVDAAKQLDALFDHFKGRYGSFDAAKEALYKDPVGVMADVSLLAGGAGAAADLAKLGKVAKIAGVVSEFTDPIRLAGKAASAVPIAKVVDAGSNALTRGALRGGSTVNTDAAKIDNAASAMREHDIPFSQAGVDKVNQALRQIQQQKEATVGAAANAGVTVNPVLVEDRLNQVASSRQWQVNPTSDVKQVEKVRQNFRANVGPNPIPADEAEALKEGTYANNQYENVPEHMAATADAEKALARGLKEELEAKIPELTGMNAQQAKLLDLQGLLEKAVNKYTNQGGFVGNLKRQMFSRTGLEVGGVAGFVTHDPALGVAAATMQAILSDPAVKSQLAFALGKAAALNAPKMGPQASVMATGLSRIDSYLQSLQPQEK